MLNAIKELGELVIQKERREILDTLVEDSRASADFKKMITINIKLEKGICLFLGTSLEDYKEERKLKYLYRRGSASGGKL